MHVEKILKWTQSKSFISTFTVHFLPLAFSLAVSGSLKINYILRREGSILFYFFNEFLSFIRWSSHIGGHKRNGMFKTSKETTTFMVQQKCIHGTRIEEWLMLGRTGIILQMKSGYFLTAFICQHMFSKSNVSTYR